MFLTINSPGVVVNNIGDNLVHHHLLRLVIGQAPLQRIYMNSKGFTPALGSIVCHQECVLKSVNKIWEPI